MGVFAEFHMKMKCHSNLEIHLSIVGDKNEFAIEYEVTKREPHSFGKVCLWVKNTQIGYYNEEVMLLAVENSLENLNNRLNSLEMKEFKYRTKEELFRLVYSDNFDNSKYLVNLGESFDDFLFFAFSDAENVHLCWKLDQNPFFEYKNYSKEIFLESVSISTFKSVVFKWNELLRS